MSNTTQLIDGYWVIGTNKWCADIYTKKQSEGFEKTLVNCSYCSDCSGCSGCSGCSYCSGFKTNPERITSPKIGSRNSQTTYYWNDEHEQVVCGCFKGTMDEFKKKVVETHIDNEHAIAYFGWITKVETYKGGEQ